MKGFQFVAYISYKNITKLFAVPWLHVTYKSLVRVVIDEFRIPPEDVFGMRLRDADTYLHREGAFEQLLHRTLSEGYIPDIRVITLNSSNDITPSANSSEHRAYDERQEPEAVDLRSKVNNVFPNLKGIEDNSNKSEIKFRPYDLEIEPSNQGAPQITEPPRYLNQPVVDLLWCQHVLLNQVEQIEAYERLLLDFEYRLKKREEDLNQQDVDLEKLHMRLHRWECELQDRESYINSREIEVNTQHYSLSKREDLTHQLSAELDMKRTRLNDLESLLIAKETVLDEAKSKIESFWKSAESNGGSHKMDDDDELVQKDEETLFNDGASTSHDHGVLSERFLMELETEYCKKRKGSLLPGMPNEKQAKLSRPSSPLGDEETTWTDYSEVNTSLEMNVDIEESEEEVLTREEQDTYEERFEGSFFATHETILQQ